jgi:hypothetical protein
MTTNSPSCEPANSDVRLLMQTLNTRIEMLRSLDEAQTKLAIDILKADNRKFYSLDMVFLAALNRSRSNIAAFLLLLEADNYFGAAPFVRMQLDSVLRLYALRLVDKPDELARQILKGEPLNKTKDRANNKMSDAYLRGCVARFEPWITKVYESGSGFIHLSDKHIFSLFTKVEDEGIFEMSISGKQPHITTGQKEEAVAAFSHITSLIVSLCKDWLNQKSCPRVDPEA